MSATTDKLEQWKSMFTDEELVNYRTNPSEVRRFIHETGGFYVDATFRSGTALDHAISMINPVITGILIESGAYLPRPDLQGHLNELVDLDQSPPYFALIEKEEWDLRRLNTTRMVLDELIKRAKEHAEKFGYTATAVPYEAEMNIAIRRNEIPFIKLFMQYGTTLNTRNISVDIQGLELSTLEYLLKNRFDPFRYSRGIGTSVFEQAFYGNNIEILKTIESAVEPDKFKQKTRKFIEDAAITEHQLDPSNPYVYNFDTLYSDEELDNLTSFVHEKIYYIKFCVALCSLGLDIFVAMNIARTLCLTQ